MTRRVEPLCTCVIGYTPAPRFMGGGQRPDWSHRADCQVYRMSWNMPLREYRVGDRVSIDGRECVVTRVNDLYADGIADYVEAP